MSSPFLCSSSLRSQVHTFRAYLEPSITGTVEYGLFFGLIQERNTGGSFYFLVFPQPILGTNLLS